MVQLGKYFFFYEIAPVVSELLNNGDTHTHTYIFTFSFIIEESVSLFVKPGTNNHKNHYLFIRVRRASSQLTGAADVVKRKYLLCVKLVTAL